MGAALWDCPAIFAESRWENRDSVTPPSAFPDETTWEGGAPVWDMTTCASEFPALSGLTTAARFSVAPVCSGVLFDAALKRSGDVPPSAATGVRDAATGEAGRLVKRIPPESEFSFLTVEEYVELGLPEIAGGGAVNTALAGRLVNRLSPESEAVSLSGDGTILEVPPPVVVGVGVAETAFPETERLVKRVSSEAESAFLSGDGMALAVAPLAAVGAGGAEALSEGAGRFEKRVSPESEGACLSEDGTPLDVPPPVVADV